MTTLPNAPVIATRILRGLRVGDYYFSFDLDDCHRSVTIRVIRPEDLTAYHRTYIYEALRAEVGEQIIMATLLRQGVSHVEVDINENHGDADQVLELALEALGSIRDSEPPKYSYRPVLTDLIEKAGRRIARRLRKQATA